MKKSTLILLIAAELLLPGCVSRKIAGINPTGPPAKLVDAGWKSSWSPNGQQLVYGKKLRGGLEALDIRTRQTKFLVDKAKDPAWSPDNRWIGYVESIALDPTRAELRVTMHIQRPAVVKTDSTATISPISSPGQSSIVLDGGPPRGRAATLVTNLPTREKPGTEI